MAKVKELTVGKEVLVNVGNYENVRVVAGMTMTVEDSDNVARVREEAMDSVDSFVRDQVDAVELKMKRASSKAGRFGV